MPAAVGLALKPTAAERQIKRGRLGDPDQALVERMVLGDERALRALMDRHLKRIVSFSSRMLGDGTEAEDVAQDVFLRAWTHAESWVAGQAKFETWLFRVAHNLCIDRLRRKAPVALDQIAEPVDPAPSAEAGIFEAQRAARVNGAIADLPPAQRAAITLCHSQGMGNIEAAKILDISVEALESLLSRGRRRLRERLQGELAALLEGVDE